jgi:hypothetical protein
MKQSEALQILAEIDTSSVTLDREQGYHVQLLLRRGPRQLVLRRTHGCKREATNEWVSLSRAENWEPGTGRCGREAQCKVGSGRAAVTPSFPRLFASFASYACCASVAPTLLHLLMKQESADVYVGVTRRQEKHAPAVSFWRVRVELVQHSSPFGQ